MFQRFTRGQRGEGGSGHEPAQVFLSTERDVVEDTPLPLLPVLHPGCYLEAIEKDFFNLGFLFFFLSSSIRKFWFH